MSKFSLKALFIFFLSFYSLYGQIDIHNFYYLEKFATRQNYKSFYFTDFNQDRSEEILLLGRDQKEITYHFTKNNISQPFRKFFYFPITSITKFKVLKNSEQSHLFISRDKRICGLFSFTKYGTLQLLNQISLDSYPTGIKHDHLFNDGTDSAIIYGEAFDGISLVTEKDFILSESKIVTGKVYSYVFIEDMNNDKLKDLVAFDKVENKMDFYYSLDSTFQLERSIPFDMQMNRVDFCDTDNDNFNDLVCSNSEGFFILYGDSVNSFKRNKFISTTGEPTKFIVHDFNKDSQNDFLFLANGKLKIIFGGSDSSFEDLTLLSYSFEDISLFNDEILLLDKKGWIFKMGKSIKEDTQILAYTSDIKDLIEIEHYGQKYLCLINHESDYSLNIFKLDKNNQFEKLYKRKINYGLERISYDSEGKNFVLWQKNSGLVELVPVNENLDEKHSVYLSNEVEDLYTYEKKLLTVSLKNDSLYLSHYKNENKSFIKKSETFVSEDIEQFCLVKNKELSAIFYIKRIDQGSELRFRTIESGNFDSKKISEIKTENPFKLFTLGKNAQFIKVFENAFSVKIFDHQGNKIFKKRVNVPLNFNVSDETVRLTNIKDKFILFIRDQLNNLHQFELEENSCKSKIIAEDVEKFFVTDSHKNNGFVIYKTKKESLNYLRIIDN